MPEPSPRMNIVIGVFSYIPLIIYFFVAILLTIVAVVSLYDAASLLYDIALRINSVENAKLLSEGIVKVVNAILLTITIIVLFETVTVYFRTKHVPVRALLIAGLTGTIREILIINYSTELNPLQLFATVGILAALIAGVILIKED
jgi:uncharacterized membrane protein (DUF373 family)